MALRRDRPAAARRRAAGQLAGLRRAGLPARSPGVGHPVPHRDHAGARARLGGHRRAARSRATTSSGCSRAPTRHTTTWSRSGSRSPRPSPTWFATRRRSTRRGPSRRRAPDRSPTRRPSGRRWPRSWPRRAAARPCCRCLACDSRDMTDQASASRLALRLARLSFADGAAAAELLSSEPLLWWDAETNAPVDDDAAAVVAALGRTADPDAALRALAEIVAQPEGAELRAAIMGSKELRARLLSLLGVSSALAEHLVTHPADWQALVGAYDPSGIARAAGGGSRGGCRPAGHRDRGRAGAIHRRRRHQRAARCLPARARRHRRTRPGRRSRTARRHRRAGRPGRPHPAGRRSPLPRPACPPTPSRAGSRSSRWARPADAS